MQSATVMLASPALVRCKTECLANTPPLRQERTLNCPLPSSPLVMVDWTRPLTRVLTLKSGVQLRTLHDAAELITRRFGSVTKSASLEHTIGLLLRVAKTGTR